MDDNRRDQPLRIAIVEDEAQVAKRVARLTRSILGNRVRSLDTFTSLEKAQISLTANPVDLMLLDLNLNGEDGFELLEPIVAERFHTIVISANKDQAIRAFEYGVLDFVPKPIDESRLSRAFDRMNGHHELNDKTQTYAKRLAIKQNGVVQLIQTDDIFHISGAADYSEVFLQSGKSFLSDKTLDSLEVLLGDSFFRIHRSHIARSSEIMKLRVSEGSRYTIELRNGTQLPVSRNRVSKLRAALTI